MRATRDTKTKLTVLLQTSSMSDADALFYKNKPNTSRGPKGACCIIVRKQTNLQKNGDAQLM